MQPKETKPTPRNFGKPMERDLLLGFAEIDAQDMVSALAWWDRHASPEWVGALDNKPIGRKRK